MGRSEAAAGQVSQSPAEARRGCCTHRYLARLKNSFRLWQRGWLMGSQHGKRPSLCSVKSLLCLSTSVNHRHPCSKRTRAQQLALRPFLQLRSPCIAACIASSTHSTHACLLVPTASSAASALAVPIDRRSVTNARKRYGSTLPDWPSQPVA